LFRAISLSDIKSIIAFSTVNQLSFMFISLLVGFPLLFIFHCLVHALFKSLLFLVAGSLIHVQFNSQSIFKLCYFNLSFDLKSFAFPWASLARTSFIKPESAGESASVRCFDYSCSNSLIRSLFIIGSCALILSFSKEGIIHSSSFICNSSFIFQCLVLGGFFTCCYLFRIYFLVFSFNFLWIKSFSFSVRESTASLAASFHSASSFYLVCFSFFSFNSFLFDIMFSYLLSASSACSFFYSIFNFHDSFFFIDLIPFSLLFPYFIFLFFLVLLFS
jgi:NADH:ubiquinone oxidoreductase subunit 5 (subunit L)/multisubunit Na+/H+ antiporter MnhA subunit